MKTKAIRRPAGAKTQPYHWFQGASVRELYDRIGAAGPDTARVEMHTSGDKMTIEVIAQAEGDSASRNPPINDSRLCPPIC